MAKVKILKKIINLLKKEKHYINYPKIKKDYKNNIDNETD